MISRLATAAWSLVMLPRATDDPLGPVGQDPDTARDIACELTVADSVCSPPEPFEPPPDVIPNGPSVGGGGFGPGTLLVVLLVLALVAFVGWLVVAIVRNRGTAADEVEDDELDIELDESVEQRVVDRERPPTTWRSAAADHRAGGRFRDAIRCEYRALVGDLARAGVVDEIPGRTSGEERAQVAELAPGVAPDFATAADLFDEAWFNDVGVGAGDDERFVTASRAVLDAVLAGATGRRERGRP